MPLYKLLIGSKVQVYRGVAKKTSGGLQKKDIVVVTDGNNVKHYKSKKQQKNGQTNKKSQRARSSWTNAYKKALSELRDKDSHYQQNILMFNPSKTYKGYTKTQISKGEKLYKLTRKYFET